METKVIIERPILMLETVYGDTLEIYASDLKAAEVGQTWSIENQDCCPNRTDWWIESYKVVYKDETGIAVLYQIEDTPEASKLTWIELH